MDGQRFVRGVFLPLSDLERVCMRTEVDRSAGTAHLAADGALAELIRHRRTGLDRENNCPAMTASLELDWHGMVRRTEKFATRQGYWP